jgi:hypothetical protein
MRRAIILLTPLLMAQSEPAPLVPEGIHSDGTEQPQLCGFAAANLAELQRTIVSDPSFREENSNNSYRVFNRKQDFVQFVFPRPDFLSFPMATCIRVVPRDGGSTINRQMHCEGTRTECDEIFIQWNEHDKQVQRSLGVERS